MVQFREPSNTGRVAAAISYSTRRRSLSSSRVGRHAYPYCCAIFDVPTAFCKHVKVLEQVGLVRQPTTAATTLWSCLQSLCAMWRSGFEIRAVLERSHGSAGGILHQTKGKITMKLTDITVTRTISCFIRQGLRPLDEPEEPWWTVVRCGACDPLIRLWMVSSYIAVKHEGRIWPHHGRFLKIDRPRRVEYTWMSEATKGAESVVTVTMEPRGDETRLRSITRECRTMRRGSAQGWLDLDFLLTLAEGCGSRGSASSSD